jgi:hypothetical protein
MGKKRVPILPAAEGGWQEFRRFREIPGQVEERGLAVSGDHKEAAFTG